ncbi:hypothetical protein ES692_01085 [Psychroserpens burtonensis]|uniref:Uncharacterized protein n=1 Tax=Psychroserpens burtonensis TaxID=49278 RepID=A0A5C7BJV2_9FLAO|nr:hypothetical protein [Psychroserpens burtonensis]TXE20412.1 hypothetical protein ES692_01085 [Psychroserpens burtonensis]
MNFEESILIFENFSEKSSPSYHLEIELVKSEIVIVKKIRKKTINEFGYFSIPEINPEILILEGTTTKPRKRTVFQVFCF